jgi:uncharacterized protein
VALAVWVDADACPKEIAEIVVRATVRLGISVTFVANRFYRPPHGAGVTFRQVPLGADVADGYIVTNSADCDVVITQDIPLASEIVKKGGIAIGLRGELFTESSIAERLSIRNFMSDLRETGVKTGGPSPFNSTHKQKFASTLDATLTKQIRSLKAMIAEEKP